MSSLVRVLVALWVALVMAFLPVEVVLFFLVPVILPVTASAAAAAATPSTTRRTAIFWSPTAFTAKWRRNVWNVPS